MKVVLNFVILLSVFVLSISSIYYTNEILKFLSNKRTKLKTSINLINEVERIQGLPLDSFLKQEEIQRVIPTKSATIYIFKKYNYEFIYIKEE